MRIARRSGNLLLASATIAVMASACRHQKETRATPSVATAGATPQVAQHDQIGAAARDHYGIRDSFALLIPGFAGIYFDGPQDVLHVNLTDTSAAEAAKSILLHFLRERLAGPPGFRTLGTERVEVHQVKYGWRQLKTWRRQIETSPSPDLSYVGLGIDEKRNRIRLDVPLTALVASVITALRAAAIPTEAVVITRMPVDTVRH